MKSHGRRYLVTAGNTREVIDRVRDLGNVFTGNTGYAIARALADAGSGLDLLTSNRSHLLEVSQQSRQSLGCLRGSGFRSHAELKGTLAALMARNSYDGVFVTAAVADYAPAGVFEVVERAARGDGHEAWVVRDVQLER